jgi:hypothetical protein
MQCARAGASVPSRKAGRHESIIIVFLLIEEPDLYCFLIIGQLAGAFKEGAEYINAKTDQARNRSLQTRVLHGTP